MRRARDDDDAAIGLVHDWEQELDEEEVREVIHCKRSFIAVRCESHAFGLLHAGVEEQGADWWEFVLVDAVNQ